MKDISIIVSISNNDCIGGNNTLLWKQSADLKRFKELTTQHIVIMGQKTFESIGTALPNRYNIVISNEKEKNIRGCVVVNSIQEAIEDANFINNEIGELKNEIFVIGGGSIYKQFIPYTSKMYVTRINCDINGDTYFPHINDDEWRIIFKEDHKKDDKNQYDYTYEIYERQN